MYIELSWESSSLVEEYGEPGGAIYPSHGDIFSIDDDDGRTRVGRFCVQYVDVGRAMNEYEPIFDVLDCYSSSTVEYYEPIFGSNAPNFSDAVEDISEGAIDGCNLLILDRLEILPQFRGRHLGLRVLRHIMVRFAPGAGIIALKAFPLQLEHEPLDEDEIAWRKLLAFDSFTQDPKLSKAKLQCYYEKVGFKTLPKSSFMIFATGWEIPSMDNES